MLFSEWRQLTPSLVRAVLVVVVSVGVEDASGMSLVPDQQVVERLAPEDSNDPFSGRSSEAPVALSSSLDAVGSETASKDPVYLTSRSQIRMRNESTWVPKSTARFLACCTVHDAVGCAVTPATCSRRVPCSTNTSAYTRRRLAKSMCTKSQAMMP
jgi:hypothetical protein